ncbi:2-dehydropantoate 2-reductase [Aspergillus sclerotiicarbonarius CBS 121057]|uniref:2-dehydropantoate 2-reductase n=1 Tax=Aspergillus sclerotiicarbonarius (strain CBS 121057 / IBT 28362) TaxID=1448318 RepID=A0A319ERA2_ASPSB|nr:2-dehydropantoate 2-reductase [Aspergillus sclerotiicarbonarius CBS 121057]
MPPKILILGGGNIGAITTYLLSHSIPASSIVVICRSNYPTISQSGMTLNSTIWGSNLHIHPTAVQSIPEAADHHPKPDGYDYVCITTKALTASQTSAAQLLKPLISPHTTIVLMQNGIGIEEPYRQTFPDNPIISAVLYTPCTQTQPGVYSHTLLTTMHLGTYPSTAPPAHQTSTRDFVSMLNKGGASATHEPEIQFARWKKLLINGSENAICALTRVRDVEFLRCVEGAEGFMRDVMGELASVARGLGFGGVDDGVVEEQLAVVTGREFPGVEPSMLADVWMGRDLETECILGNVVRLARGVGVEVPRVEALYFLLKGLEGGVRMRRGEGGR